MGSLNREYEWDIKKGMDIAVPENYFPNDDPKQRPIVRWRSSIFTLLFTNWLKLLCFTKKHRTLLNKFKMKFERDKNLGAYI